MNPIVFLLNDYRKLTRTGTHWAMVTACLELGYPVYVTDVTHLEATGTSTLFAEARRIDRTTLRGDFEPSSLKSGPTVRVNLREVAAIFVRTTPGKDIARAWAHRLTLEVLRMVADLGVHVINNPAGLQKASSKLYTVYLPDEFVPRTKVCHSISSVERFVEELGTPFVVKPLLGSQGRDVYFFDDLRSLNLRQVVENLGSTGYLVVQEYLEQAMDGDIRVLTVGDQLVGGEHPIGVRRTPAEGERRSNVSLGGTASVVSLSARQTNICTEIAKLLHQDGIYFAGLDLIGEKVVEANVFSPSGLQELDRWLAAPCSMEVVRALLEQNASSQYRL